jgi:hypothetical protein
VAVAVEALPFVVLDDANRVVEVGSAAGADFERLLGESVLDAFPGSEPIFGPYYEQARDSGEPIAFAEYYDGYVLRLTAAPGPNGLTVTWETLGRLDVLTLDGLRASLAAVVERLEVEEVRLSRDRRGAALQVIEGGL